jgi:CheY-like chemotaxis protein
VSDDESSEILVVDADPENLQLMCDALRREGCKVVPTSGYFAAVGTHRLHSGHFALLVTAVSLPKKNGCELARVLLALQPDLKVLFVSAPSGAEVCRYYRMQGPGLHFLEKPFKRAEFLDQARLILEKGEAHPLHKTAGQP